MARFKIISKDGSSVKYEGKLRYIGSYLKPSYVEFSEISSSTPINWEIGDYVDYSRTGMRYRLFSVPQVVKNARAGSHGNAFSYTNVQFFAATKELEIALFRDLVSGDNNIHFSTSPDVATFEDVAGIARRIQACMDDLYPGKWVIKVADFDAESDAEVIEKITTAKDFALSGGTCLDALSKIYELWQDIGWIHSYDSTSGKDIITIGYANKRIDANTTNTFLYGKGNGLTAIKKSQANKDEFATRLYVYGSERNLPSRYYNDKDILNAESVDIRNLMLPMDVWGKTEGKPDARKAYIENAEAVAKIGVIPRVHYFDSEDAGADIYPSIEGMTVGMLRKVLSDMGDTAYSPSYEIYADASERVDEVGGVISLPTDEGKIGEAIELTTIFIPSFSKTKSTGIVESVDLIESHILYEGLIKSSFEMGEITVKPSLECTVTDADFSSVVATLTLDDSLGASTSSPSKTISIPAEYDESRNLWVLPLKDISVKFDRKTNSNGFYIYLYVTISATKNTPGVSNDAVVSIYRGTADVEVKQVLSKTFNIRLKQIGFNLNLQGDLGKGKTISLKTGKCVGRNFIISSAKYNPGADSWDITCKRQQDETLGLLFPNTNYEIQTGDRFVLLDIVMPESYIRVAMERLLAEGQRLFNQVSTVRSNYEPSIDAKLMAESGRHLREGMFMEISDSDIVDNTTEHILIDTLSIYEDESAIPTYKVTLRERRKVTYKGTPSAAATTKTSSVEDGETDMSEYAKIAYVDKKDKEFSSTLSKILDWFSLKDGVLLTKYNLASEKEVSAKGINASQGGGSSYNRLDSWSAYDSSKAGYVLSALLGYDLHSRVTNLENAEVDLSDYYTKSQTNSQIASAIGAIDLSPYATKEALNILEGKHNTLRSEFDALSNLLSSDTTDYINTWNEVVAFLDGYKDESDLATILSGMNADISSRLLTSTFDSWKADTYTPLANLVANHTTKLDSIDASITNINTRLEGVDKTIEDHIAEFIAFRANFEISDDLILVRKNFASTEEVSAKGINQGTGGGSSYNRLDSWSAYDSSKAGYVLSALLGYDLHSRVTNLENAEVDLSDYYTKSQTNSQIASAIGAIDLSPYATKEALNILEGKHNTLRSEFDALSNLLSSDTTDYINTWNEVVAFLDGYKDESDLATILSGMNADISSRLLTSTFDSWKADTYTPLANLVANHTTKLDSIDASITNINTRLEGVDKTIEDHIAEFIAFRANFEISDDLILVRKNFASTEEVSAKGINQGTGGGSSYNRLDSWSAYDSSKAGYVLSAGLGYGLKVAIDELEGYNLDSRVSTIENSYVSKDAGGVVNGGLVVSSLAIAGGSSSQFLKADGSLDGTSYLPTSGGTITGDLTIQSSNLNIHSGNIIFNNSHYLVASGNELAFYNTQWNTILHTGNIGSYALSTSGGTIEGSLTVDSSSLSPLLINTSHSSGIGLRLAQNHILKAEFNWDIYAGTYMYNHPSSSYIGIKDDGTPHYNGNPLIHSGNIGSQSVAYATNAGGIQGSTSSINFARGHNRLEMINDHSGSIGDFVSAHQSGISVITEYVGWQMTSYGGNIENPYFRSLEDTGRWKPWRQLAFLDDNVAGAQKLVDGSGNPIIHNSGAIFYIGDTIYPTIPTNILGSEIVLRYGASATNGLILDSSGNVTVGNGYFAGGGTKLYVDGGGYFSGALTVSGTTKSERYLLSNSEDSYCGLMPNSAITLGGNTGDIWLFNNQAVMLYGGKGVIVTSSFDVRGAVSINSTLSVANTISSADSITTLGGHVSAYNGFLVNNQNKLSGLVPNSRITGGGNATDVWMYVEAGKAIILGESGIDLRAATTISSSLSVSGILTVGGASIHPTANNPYFQLYQNNKYWYWQADDNYAYIGGTMSKALRIDQDGNTLIRGSLGVDAPLTASNGLTVSKGISATDGIVSDWITAANITANTSASIATLTVSGLSILTGGIATNDIHGNGQSLYLGNASNYAYIKVREDMVGSSSMWSIPRDGKATFTSLTTPTLSVTESATIASVTIEAGNATLSNLTVNTAATLKQLVVGADGMLCNAPATFNDFIYGSSITPRTDNYYVLGNNNYKWYAVTAYNVNVHDAITIEAGKELRFKDDNGVVHTLKYDSTKQAFVFDGNVNATGEMSAKKLNA